MQSIQKQKKKIEKVCFNVINKPLYYILNKEIQDFLVKIKILFLIYFLCRLDAFPIMVANRYLVYSWVPFFFFFLFFYYFKFLCSCTSQIDTSCLLRLSKTIKTKTDAGSEIANFVLSPGVFFRGEELNEFMNSFKSCGKASSHIIDA